MKKVALSLASVLAAATFAQEASAIPSFARQTGMACSSCHQQHYPVLNGFGQAFKAAGYTMMGAQEKVEGEHLSIPAVLNGSFLLKARYQKDNKPGVVEKSGMSPSTGEWQIPDEFSLFFGGRVADTDTMKIGFMFEGNTAATALVAGFKMPIVIDTGAVKLMAIPYLTDALGSSYGFEQASTGAVRGVRWAEHRKEISAQQYVGTDGAATGLAFVALHEMGYINVSRWSPNFTAGGAAGKTPFDAAAAHSGAVALTSTYVRAAVTPNIADWALHIGLQSWSGLSDVGGTDFATKATAVDFQGHGNVAGMETGVYATYAKVPAVTTGDLNLFSLANDASGGLNAAGATDKTAMTIGADVSVIPHVLHIGAAYRNAKNASNKSDNAITGMVVYDLTQNVALHVNHSMYSGDANPSATAKTQLTTFLLEAAW